MPMLWFFRGNTLVGEILLFAFYSALIFSLPMVFVLSFCLFAMVHKRFLGNNFKLKTLLFGTTKTYLIVGVAIGVIDFVTFYLSIEVFIFSITILPIICAFFICIWILIYFHKIHYKTI